MINYKQKTLSNGIRLVTCPTKSTEAVAILISVGVGGRFEPKDKVGISHFLEHLFFKGTKKHPSVHDLSCALDNLGADYNAYTSEETTDFYIQSSADVFQNSLDILSEMYLNPLFPEKEIAKERAVIVEEANMRRDIPQLHVQVLAQKQMFPDSPLGEDLIGTPETLQSISRPDISNYFNKNYNGTSTIIAVCGNPKKFNWEKEVEKRFTSKDQGIKPENEMFSDSNIKDSIVAQERKIDQSHLVLSTRLFSKTDPRRYQASILQTILGGGMSSRLFSEIREKRSLAYYVNAGINWYEDTGSFVVSAGVNSGKVEEALKVTMSEFKKISQKPPSTKELERAKNQLKGKLALSLEGSFEIASYLAEETRYENKIRQPEDIVKEIGKTKPQDIQNLAREIFNSDKMGLAIIGPQINNAKLKQIINGRQDG